MQGQHSSGAIIITLTLQGQTEVQSNEVTCLVTQLMANGAGSPNKGPNPSSAFSGWGLLREEINPGSPSSNLQTSGFPGWVRFTLQRQGRSV